MNTKPNLDLKLENARLEAELTEKNRELEIEAALERVRVRAMAMHASQELKEVAYELRKQMGLFGQKDLDTCVIHLYEEAPDFIYAWAAIRPPESAEEIRDFTVILPKKGLLIIEEAMEACSSNRQAYVLVNEGEKMTQWISFMKKEVPEAAAILLGSSGKSSPLEMRSYWSFADFAGGSLIMVTIELPDELSRSLLQRFANVFGLAYRRFADMKQAEAQAKESRIQLALERVRARTMAMQKSEELHEVIQLVFDQLQQLGFDIDAANFALNYKETTDLDLFLAVPHGSYPVKIHIPYFKHPVFDRFNKAKEKGGLLIDTLTRGEKDRFFEHFFKHVPGVPEETKVSIFGRPGFVRSTVLMKNTALTIHNYEGTPYSEAENAILLRFAQVFEQTYTRFTDLKQAEEQARESKIQLALERVRARTMAMQRSEELAETASVLFQQLHNLGIIPERVFVGIPDNETRKVVFWGTEQGGTEMNTRFEAEMDATYGFRQIAKAWADKAPDVEVILKDQHLTEHINYVANVLHMPVRMELVQEQRVLYSTYFSKGWLVVVTPDILSGETMNIMQRFAAVFDQTYTRFLDLERAEAQAREGQIQLGLERVRAKAMAMQTSEELNELIGTVFSELTKLDFILTRCLIMIFDPETKASRWWMANSEAPAEPMNYLVQNHKNPAYDAYLRAWKERDLKWNYALKGKVKRDWDDFLFVDTELAQLPGPVIEGMKAPEQVLLSASFNNFGCLTLVTLEPLPREHSDIMLRFAKVFDMSYTRFNDLKQAEARAREGQIQLGLERVRAAAMAMHNSQGVGNATALVFSELYKLGINTIRCGVCIVDNSTEQIEVWSANMSLDGNVNRGVGKLDMNAHPLWVYLLDAWRKKVPSFSYELTGEELIDYYKAIRTAPDYHAPAGQKPAERPDERQYCNCYIFNEGCLFTFTEEPFSPETNQVLEKFAAVFGLTYRRYLDLTKAEAQAREAQIEAALEKIRSTSLAMHRSDDIASVVAVLFEKLKELGLIFDGGAGIHLFAPGSKDAVIWVLSPELRGPICNKLPYDEGAFLDNPIILDVWKAKDAGEHIINKYYSFEQKNRYFQYVFKHNSESTLPKPVREFILDTKSYTATFIAEKNSLLGISSWTEQLLPEENIGVLRRVARVFEQAYIRFLDLQKAEAQAREGQIESALERVRSKTMAMHNSNDVADTVAVMFDELLKLGIEKDVRSGICILNNPNEMEVWTAYAKPDGKVGLNIGSLETGSHQMLVRAYDLWTKKELHSTYTLIGEDQKDYYRALNNSAHYNVKFDIQSLPEKTFQNAFYFPEGFIFIFSHEQLASEETQIFKRFAGVFGQTYRRYLDLRKAEAAAREAQVEAALERVRSKAMAMRSSDDLNATANTVFVELRRLGVELVRCGVGLLEKQSHISTIHAATNSAEGGSLEVLGKLVMEEHPVLVEIYKHWQQNEDYFPVLEGDSLKNYYKRLKEDGLPVPEWKSGEKQYGYFFQFADGCLYAWSAKQENAETVKTLKRFTSVIGLTYTRYMELQKAETNAKEAIKQASLDRVRAEIASMRKRSDLERITPLIWDELTILGIPFIRCGVFIMDEEQRLIHTFLSTPDGKAIGAFHIPFDTTGNFEKMVSRWQHKEPYIDHWKEEAFAEFAETLVKQGAIASKAQYMRTLPHEGVHLNFLPFLQGMLYVGNKEPLTQDDIDLVQAVAEAFSTAYARYEDFNKLEAAKQQVDNTLSQLRTAQNKLIQSEKMASLGELTAGIAHEIQNPLNFVNNFSEVSAELIDEMDEELDKGDIEEVKAIAADIRENLQKIRHHGGRADGIVKGMLQHSRASSGEKEPTDINKLADEYLHLAYHGLRAKDKSFNAELIMNLDEKLPRASVVPQDIGRVILNMINNAFYATQQKAKTANGTYRPEVTVSTSAEDGQVIVKVKDNGNGIPEAIRDKIMQPFFTTKPTGEGTGLGLSLSYDIVVKGHDGKIDVDTKEGEGSEFAVILPVA